MYIHTPKRMYIYVHTHKRLLHTAASGSSGASEPQGVRAAAHSTILKYIYIHVYANAYICIYMYIYTQICTHTAASGNGGAREPQGACAAAHSTPERPGQDGRQDVALCHE